jgi:hypothetical protein
MLYDIFVLVCLLGVAWIFGALGDGNSYGSKY